MQSLRSWAVPVGSVVRARGETWTTGMNVTPVQDDQSG